MQYAAKTQELIQTFKNTVLAKHIIDKDGIPILTNFCSIGDNETIMDGMIPFGEWGKRNSPQ